MTDTEIIKAFEYCITHEDCDNCTMVSDCPTSFGLQNKVLDLINRQRAEVERLKSKVNRLKRYDEERDIRLHARLIATAKSEAYKEFAKFLIDKSDNGVISTADLPEYVKEMGCGCEDK